jgi:hypothetical protein
MTRSRINAAKVAQEFAVRLNEILPPGFSATPGEDHVRFDAPDGPTTTPRSIGHAKGSQLPKRTSAGFSG